MKRNVRLDARFESTREGGREGAILVRGIVVIFRCIDNHWRRTAEMKSLTFLVCGSLTVKLWRWCGEI